MENVRFCLARKRLSSVFLTILLCVSSAVRAEELDARYIITFSTSGETARLVSHYRTGRPVLALAPSERVWLNRETPQSSSSEPH